MYTEINMCQLLFYQQLVLGKTLLLIKKRLTAIPKNNYLPTSSDPSIEQIKYDNGEHRKYFSFAKKNSKYFSGCILTSRFGWCRA